MKPNPKTILKWTQALRSGKYTQTRERMHDAMGYCCLGVACDRFVPKNKLSLNDGGYIASNTPDQQPFAPDWLQRINDDFACETNQLLSRLNDGTDLRDNKGNVVRVEDQFTFDEIADLLELVYVHNTLDGV